MSDIEWHNGSVGDMETTFKETLASIEWSRHPRELVIDAHDNFGALPNLAEIAAERFAQMALASGFLHGLREVVPRFEPPGVVLSLKYKEGSNNAPAAQESTL